MTDELEPLITQCPNCDTRFRVNEAQLQAAGGKVRCGACLTVFDGTSYLLLDGELLPAESEDVDALLDEIDAQEQDLLAPELDSGFEPAPAVEVEPPIAELEDRVESGEVELAELEAQLLAELKGSDPLVLTPQSIVTTDEDVGEEEVFSSLVQANQEAVPESSQTETASPPQAVATAELEVTETEAEEPPAEQAQENIGAVAEPTDTVPDAVREVEEAPELDDAPALDEAPWMQAEAKAADRVADIPPGLFEEEPPRRSLVSSLILILALVALPLQVLWYQFEEWSKIDSLRPWYAQACNLIGCELPVRRNVDLISARNSVLRDHPELSDALVYDALLINQAPFDQPFPLVELTLSTVDGHLVASRRFKPAEYLDGEVATAQMMASFTPIHISLAIKDPGEAPLSFKIRFLPHY